MREIKFRGKRVDNGEWVYGKLLNNKRIITISDEEVEKMACFDMCDYQEEVVEDTIGQFIGIKDKHGKEIYDGDIMESHCELQVVCYWRIGYDSGAGLCGYMLIPLRDFSFKFKEEIDKDFEEVYTGRDDEHFLDCDRCVDLSTDYVVGNIWDNPEMIKEGK